MGPEELVRVAAVAPGARLIASHMDAVNHARLDRAVLRAFVESRRLQNRFLIPEDGEILIFFSGGELLTSADGTGRREF